MHISTTTFLRLEAGVVFALGYIAYDRLDISWWYWLLLLVPDLFMVGYTKNNKLGALLYNIGHTYLLPAGIALVAYLLDWKVGYGLAIIWAAHIAMDRALGYGLKKPEGFEHTHLGKIGKGHKASKND